MPVIGVTFHTIVSTNENLAPVETNELEAVLTFSFCNRDYSKDQKMYLNFYISVTCNLCTEKRAGRIPALDI